MKTKICIVQSSYNEDITDKLCSGASKVLKLWRIKHAIEKVSGAFEIPVTIAKLAKKYDTSIKIKEKNYCFRRLQYKNYQTGNY